MAVKETAGCGHTDACDKGDAEVTGDRAAGTAVAPPGVWSGDVHVLGFFSFQPGSRAPALTAESLPQLPASQGRSS